MEDTMDKAQLVEILKRNGLNIAEDAASMAVKAVFKAIPEIVIATENKFDDLLIPLVGILEPQILALVDKIDGEEG
jgi:hypothetical protein